MRTIVFFDLPNISYEDRKKYNKFRKFLINEGFIMLQESVYSKITLNSQQADFLTNRIYKNSPKKGIIQLLIVTEKQYSEIKNIIGNTNTNIVNDESRLVIIWYLKLIF